MTQYYIYKMEAEGVYIVSTDDKGASLAQFESSEYNQAAVLQAADEAMVINGLLDNKKPVSYIYC